MAEGILKRLDKNLYVVSAGTNPSKNVHPLAIVVMREIGIDISKNKPKNVSKFIKQEFDYVITVCDDADRNCPVFTGKVKKRLHYPFDDPAKFIGSENDTLNFFRKIRDEINGKFTDFYLKELREDT